MAESIFHSITKQEIEKVLTSKELLERLRPPGVPSPEEEALVEPQPFKALSGLLPSTAPELAADIALFGLGGPVTKLLGRGVGMVTRLLAPPIAAGLAGQFTGQDPVQAAMPAILSTLAGESTALLGRNIATPVKEIFRGLETQRVKQGIKDATTFALSAGKESTPFSRVIPNRQALVNLQDPNIGNKVLRESFQAVDDEAVKFFGGKKFTFNAIKRKQLPTGQIVAEQEPVTVTVATISDHIKTIKSISSKVGSGAESFHFREAVREAEAEYKKILAANPGILRSYEAAIKDYDKGLGVISILRDSGAVRGSTSGPWLDNAKLGQYLLENVGEFPPVKFPEIWRTVSRGQLPGAMDVLSTFGGGRVIFPKPTAGAPAGAISIPKLSRLKRAGGVTQALPGMEAAIPEFLGIRGITELGQ